jgi:hypothetical protein
VASQVPAFSSGTVLAHLTSEMKSERKTLDQRPGNVPEIRADGDAVYFYLDVRTEHARLIIRCDPDGGVSASLASQPSADPRG